MVHRPNLGTYLCRNASPWLPIYALWSCSPLYSWAVPFLLPLRPISPPSMLTLTALRITFGFTPKALRQLFGTSHASSPTKQLYSHLKKPLAHSHSPNNDSYPSPWDTRAKKNLIKKGCPFSVRIMSLNIFIIPPIFYNHELKAVWIH